MEATGPNPEPEQNRILSQEIEAAAAKKLRRRSWTLALRFLISKALLIGISIFLAVFFTVLLINNPNTEGRDVGPQQLETKIQQQINLQLRIYEVEHPEFHELPAAEQEAVLQELQQELIEESGLNLPFLPRHLKWTWKALTFNWGRLAVVNVAPIAILTTKTSSYTLNSVVLQHLPYSILLAASSFFLILLLGVPLALVSARNYGKWFDRLLTLLSPLSSIPAWVMGIILILIFAIELNWLPMGGMLDARPPDTKAGYIPIILKHMILPVASILITTLFQLTYSWRTYFVSFAEEDYVDLGKAQGLPTRSLERKYILKPSLTYVITSFTLMFVSYWQISMALEVIFSWQGIGWLYIKYGLPNFWGESMYRGELLIALAMVVIMAYLLGIIVFLLDIVYLWVDPRIRYGLSDTYMRSNRPRRTFAELFPRRIKSPKTAGQELALHVKKPAKTWAQHKAHYQAVFGYIRQQLKRALYEVKRYPSAVFGLSVILLLLAGSIYAVTALPYETIGEEWGRSTFTGQPERPRLAKPSWVNLFRTNDYLSTIKLSTASVQDNKTVTPLTDSASQITYRLTFEYDYQDFPSEVLLYTRGFYETTKPFVNIEWITPDNRSIPLKGMSVGTRSPINFETQMSVKRLLAGNDNWKEWFVVGTNYPTPAYTLLFADPFGDEAVVLPGTYQLLITVTTFEKNSDIQADLYLFGQVYGLAGTDYYRRDLIVPLLWGMPFALIIGLLGSVSTALISMLAAAAGAWYGGWVDNLVQRISEVNLVLPILAISVLGYAYLGVSIWVVIGVIILSIAFGAPTRNFRAAFLQIRSSPYIEAAEAYGASDFRIVGKYMMPRILTSLIPQIILLIPSFVFLEATLGLFNISSDYPTWGKIIYQALTKGAWFGSRYWVAQPLFLLMITGLGFAMFGFALERILNPKLTRD